MYLKHGRISRLDNKIKCLLHIFILPSSQNNINVKKSLSRSLSYLCKRILKNKKLGKMFSGNANKGPVNFGCAPSPHTWTHEVSHRSKWAILQFSVQWKTVCVTAPLKHACFHGKHYIFSLPFPFPWSAAMFVYPLETKDKAKTCVLQIWKLFKIHYSKSVLFF